MHSYHLVTIAQYKLSRICITSSRVTVLLTVLQLELATITSSLVGWSCVLSMEDEKVIRFIKCRVYKLLTFTEHHRFFSLTFMIHKVRLLAVMLQADHFTAAIIYS